MSERCQVGVGFSGRRDFGGIEVKEGSFEVQSPDGVIGRCAIPDAGGEDSGAGALGASDTDDELVDATKDMGVRMDTGDTIIGLPQRTLGD